MVFSPHGSVATGIQMDKVMDDRAITGPGGHAPACGLPRGSWQATAGGWTGCSRSIFLIYSWVPPSSVPDR